MPIELTRSVRRVSVEEEEALEYLDQVLEVISFPKKPDLDTLPLPVQDFLQNRLNEAIRAYADFFVEQLARAAGTPVPGLRRANKKTSRSLITISSQSPAWRVTVGITASGSRINLAPPALESVWDNIDRDMWRRLRSRGRRTLRISLLNDLSNDVIRACFKDFPRHTRYMPAARSGLMQSHKALAGSLIRRASYAGIREMQIPAVSGIIADFLGEMIEVGVRPYGQFPEHAERLEREILRGAIELQENVSGGYPEPVYRSPEGEFPLGRTSSMVSELAPVVLFLRHLMQRGDLLMIEEPEAHLHPQAQVAFAKSLVRLVNAGLSIAMTTHSEFFLQQLNNAMLAAKVDNSDSDKINLEPDMRISTNNVAAYLFRTFEDDGTQVVGLTIDSREGIPEDSFSEVAEYLYAQTVALDKRVSDDSEE